MMVHHIKVHLCRGILFTLKAKRMRYIVYLFIHMSQILVKLLISSS